MRLNPQIQAFSLVKKMGRVARRKIAELNSREQLSFRKNNIFSGILRLKMLLANKLSGGKLLCIGEF